ncbi:hypothetical protein NLI96_g5661 [Meripilus lineatus]|uniref:Uncharacterized protein n=1 Tax=Meripilus lineatus TaxID=2056292 RepID=A0AAD5V7W8_9APHY|nr:hypothetical protein NLI96_g5661 [Physisporinus lineatus]
MAKKRERADSGNSQRPASKRRQQEDVISSSGDDSDPDQRIHNYNLRKAQKKDDRQPGKKAGLQKKTMLDIRAAAAVKKGARDAKALKKLAEQMEHEEEVARVSALVKNRAARDDAEDSLMDQDESRSDVSDFQPDTSAYERSKKAGHTTSDAWLDDDDKTRVDDDEEWVDDDDVGGSDGGGAGDVESDVQVDHREESPVPKLTSKEKKYMIVNMLRKAVLGDSIEAIDPPTPQVRVFPIGPPKGKRPKSNKAVVQRKTPTHDGALGDVGLHDDWRERVQPIAKTATSKSKSHKRTDSKLEGLTDVDVTHRRPPTPDPSHSSSSQVRRFHTIPLRVEVEIPSANPSSGRQRPPSSTLTSKATPSGSKGKKIDLPPPVSQSNHAVRSDPEVHEGQEKETGKGKGKGKGKDKGKGKGKDKGKEKEKRKGKGKGKGKEKRRQGDSSSSDSDSDSFSDSPEDVIWQKELGHDQAVVATVLEWYGMQRDPWKLQEKKSGFFRNFVQQIVNRERPEKKLILRQVFYDWRRYFFRAASRVVISALQKLKHIRVHKGIPLPHDVTAIAKWSSDIVDTGTLFYRNPQLKVCIPPLPFDLLAHIFNFSMLLTPSFNAHPPAL